MAGMIGEKKGGGGGGGAEAIDYFSEKTCCISENIRPFYMKCCTYTVWEIWNKSE